jgi:hypothetical protein
MQSEFEGDEFLIERIWRQLDVPQSEYQHLVDFANCRLEDARSNGWDERFTTPMVRRIALEFKAAYDNPKEKEKP